MRVDVPERDARQDGAEVVGVRLHTRAPVTLRWLSESVVPAVREVRDRGGAAVYLRRGWLGGPHVDIVARGVARGGAVLREVANRLDAGEVATGSALTEEAYLAQAREFGRLEAVPPPYLPMAEHGAVKLLGQDDVGSREPLLGSLREREVVNGVLCGPLVAMIDELAAHPANATIRLAEAFVALADSYLLGLGHGVFSFRSHAEAFLAWAAPTKDVRPVFAARLATEVPSLRKVVEQRLSGEVGPAAGGWRTAFAYSAGALDSAATSGALTSGMLESITAAVDLTGMGPPGAPGVVPQGTGPDTAFHRAVSQSGVTDEPMWWFASYRMLINLFYQQLPLLTVSPMQRYYMCYAIAETVDEVLGESWQDRLNRGAALVANGQVAK